MSITNILIIFLLTLIPSLIFACNYPEKTLESINVSTQTSPAHSGLFITKEPVDNKARSNQSIIRSRIVTIKTAHLLNKLTSGQLNTLSLNFFDNATFTVVRRKQTVNESGNITWVGELPSVTGSIAILSVSKERVDGSLDIPNKGLFTVRYQLNGTHVLEEVDRSALQ